MAAPAPAVPHRLGSIAIPRVIATRTFTPGGPPIGDIVLRNLGYLDKIRVRLAGTVTVGAAAPNPRPGFPFNAVRRFLLDLPGMDDSFDLSGYHAKLQQIVGYSSTMLRHGFEPLADARPALANAAYDATVRDNFPVALSTTNAWNITFEIDPKRSYRDHRGILPMSAAAGESTLQIEPGALADIFDNPANVTATELTVEVVQIMRTPPIGGVAAPDTTWIVKHDEQVDNVVAGGEFDVRLRQEGVLLNALAHVVLDDDAFPNASSNSVDSISLIVNEDTRIDGIPTRHFLYEQASKYLQPLPAGVFAFDFDSDQSDIPYVDGGYERHPGWVATQRGYETVLRFHLASGATLDGAKIITSTKRLIRA